MPSRDVLLICVVILCCCCSSIITSEDLLTIDPDETRTFSELIASRGYILQEHHVLTPDGYILTIHRPVTRDFDPATYNTFRKPVIAMHGVLNDATYFFFGSPHLESNTSYCGDTFGFCLLKSGRYDLWVPNDRGNGRSDLHLKYTTKDPQFWEFSWDHLAVYDLPAIIDLVQTRTGHRRLAYLGFSQGAAKMFALLSLKPQYASVIRPFIAWAPAVFIGRATSVLGPAVRNLHPFFMWPGQFPGIGNPLGNSFQQWYLCRPRAGRELCNQLLNAVFGPSTINVTRITVYGSFGPNPSSNWQLAHFGQNGQSGRFRRFDYRDASKNLRAYGTPTPPDYPLERIPKQTKILIMHGATDGFVHPLDARKLISILKTAGVDVTGHLVDNPRWSHADFVMGIDAGKYVYDHTLRYLDLHAWNGIEGVW